MRKITIIDNIDKERCERNPASLLPSPALSKMITHRSGKAYVISHSADLDGVGCAALLHHNFRIPMDNIFFTNYDGPSMRGLIKAVKAENPANGVVIITDIGPPRSYMKEFAALLRYLKERNNLVVWLDHHLVSEQDIAAFSPHLDFWVTGENELNCATEVVARVLCNDRFSYSLAKKVHVSDFAPVTTPLYRSLAKVGGVINYINWDADTRQANLRKLVRIVSEGMLWDRFMGGIYQKFLIEEKENLDMVLKGAVVITAGKKIAVGFGNHGGTNKATHTLLEKTGSDIAIVIWEGTHSAHLRSTEGVDCHTIAEAFGGGGHPQAAGFEVKGSLNFKDKAALINRIAKAARSIYA